MKEFLREKNPIAVRKVLGASVLSTTLLLSACGEESGPVPIGTETMPNIPTAEAEVIPTEELPFICPQDDIKPECDN